MYCPSIHSLTHSLTHSLNHSLNHSLTQSLTQSLNHSLNHSINHSLTQSLTYSITQSLTHCLLSDPSTQSWVINAITRLVAQIGYLPEYVHSMIALHLTSVDTDVQQVISNLTTPTH